MLTMVLVKLDSGEVTTASNTDTSKNGYNDRSIDKSTEIDVFLKDGTCVVTTTDGDNKSEVRRFGWRVYNASGDPDAPRYHLLKSWSFPGVNPGQTDGIIAEINPELYVITRTDSDHGVEVIVSELWQRITN